MFEVRGPYCNYYGVPMHLHVLTKYHPRSVLLLVLPDLYFMLREQLYERTRPRQAAARPHFETSRSRLARIPPQDATSCNSRRRSTGACVRAVGEAASDAHGMRNRSTRRPQIGPLTAECAARNGRGCATKALDGHHSLRANRGSSTERHSVTSGETSK